MGRLYGRLGGPRSRTALINLRVAFPDWSDDERRRVMVGHFENLGRHLAEIAQLGGSHRNVLLAGIEVEGFEHYQAARESSPDGGVILMTAHFGAWEMCAAGLVQRGLPLVAIHRELGNPLVEQMVRDWRSAIGLELLPLGRAAVGALRVLRQGRTLVALADQNAGREEGLFVPFFGRPASTRSALVRLAMRTGAPLVPAYAFRQAGSPAGRHRIRFFPALELEREGAEGALERNLTHMNRAIEEAIRQAPDHWMWGHRRWRTRPEGLDRLYPPRRRGVLARLARRRRATADRFPV
jgi:KDO2-lipid IV(A) lauroyltransferase